MAITADQAMIAALTQQRNFALDSLAQTDAALVLCRQQVQVLENQLALLVPAEADLVTLEPVEKINP
jgi:hypothetical protein